MSSRDESRLFDVRTIERNLRKGLVNKKDYEKHVKGLADAADKSTVCNPEAQGREPGPPVSHRPAVVITPAAPVDEDALDDEALLDDEDDDDEDEELEDEAEEEAK